MGFWWFLYFIEGLSLLWHVSDLSTATDLCPFQASSELLHSKAPRSSVSPTQGQVPTGTQVMSCGLGPAPAFLQPIVLYLAHPDQGPLLLLTQCPQASAHRARSQISSSKETLIWSVWQFSWPLMLLSQLKPPPWGKTGSCTLCCTVSANRRLTSCLSSVINVYQYKGSAVRLTGIDFFSVLNDKKEKSSTFSQLLCCSQCFMQSDSCSNHSHLVILTLQNHLQEKISMCF